MLAVSELDSLLLISELHSLLMTQKSSMVPYGQHFKESALVAPESTLVDAVEILVTAKSVVVLC